jgi:predicted dinucleotide-binding enzyme
MAVPKTWHDGGCRDHGGMRRARSSGRRAGVTDRGAVDHDDSVANRVAATGDEQVGLDALHVGTVRRAHFREPAGGTRE